MKTIQRYTTILVCIALVIGACKKDKGVENPFEDPANDPPVVVVPPDNFARNSIQGLHKYIFSVKCANAGCHDGVFEPDFRTVESAYNTLVYARNSQKGDSSGFTYVIVPGDTTNSWLHERITKDVNNPPGSPNYGEAIMPLYSTLTTQEIGYIEQWIMNGAKDMFDSGYVVPNAEPQMLGVSGWNGGLMGRAPFKGPILVPGGTTSMELWFAFIDDATDPTNFTHNKIKFSKSMNNFDAATEYSLTIDAGSPLTQPGFYGNPPGYYPASVVHYHKITINPQDFGVTGDIVYIQVYVQDADHATPTTIPEYNAAYTHKKYFAIALN